MSVGFIFLDVHRVVPLGEQRGVVVGVLDVDVDEDAGGEQGLPTVASLHLQHYNKYTGYTSVNQTICLSRFYKPRETFRIEIPKVG